MMKSWNQFIKDMANDAQNKYRSTEEYTYYKYRREEIDQILDGMLLEDQKELVDTFLQEIDDAVQREAQAVYFQGMLDGVSVLKYIGVLE